MAFSITNYTGNGVTVEYTIGFEYLADSHIQVYLDGIIQTLNTHYTINKALGKLTFLSAPANGKAIKFRRITPRETVNRFVDFVSGSGLTEEDLDNSVLYALYISQEILDTPLEDGSVTGSAIAPEVRFFASNYATSAGGTSTFTLDLAPSASSYITGMMISFKAHTTATFPMTINVDGLGAKAVRVAGGNPATNSILTNRMYYMVYDGTAFELVNPSTITVLTGPLSANLDTNGYHIDFDNLTGIRDDSGNNTLVFRKSASAVNYVELSNASTGNSPGLFPAGADTNVDMRIGSKGVGKVKLTTGTDISGPLVTTGSVTCTGLTATGTPVLGGNTYPTTTGTSGQILTTNGSGTLSFVSPPTVLLSTTVITGTPTTLEFVSLMNTTYNRYTVVFNDVYPTTATRLRMQVSDNNGSSYLTAGNYNYFTSLHVVAFPNDSDSSTSATYIQPYYAIGNAAGKGINGTMTIFGSSTDRNTIHWDITYINSSNEFNYQMIGSTYKVSNLNISFNAWKFFLESGTFAGGTIRVYGHI